MPRRQWPLPVLFMLMIIMAIFNQLAARAATFTVTNLNDSGLGWLRQAIVRTNAEVGDDTITLNDLDLNDLILPVTIDAVIGPLADDGGPTPTYLPVSDSLAIDAGDNAWITAGVTTDQHSTDFPRLAGGAVDIGAEEGSPLNAVVAQPGYSVELLNDGLAGPVELDFDQASNILVANEGIPNGASDDFVSKLTLIGMMLEREFISGLEGASGLEIDINGNIYVSQDVERPISKYDSTGAFILQFAPHRPQFSDPNTLALTQDGRILAAVENVPSDNQWRVLAYDIQTGQREADFTLPFEFELVNTVVYRNGQVLIGGAVVQGSPTGGPILIAEEGQAPIAYKYNDQLASGYINGLAVGADGTLFVTDNTRLRKVSTDGSVTLLATGFELARGLMVKDSCVFVSDFRDGTRGALYRVCPNLPSGDVNGDGNVNALDVVGTINAVLGIQPSPDADVNGDGNVNALDVVFVINRVLGV